MLLKDAFILDFVSDDRNVVLSYGPCQVYAHQLLEFWFLITVSHLGFELLITYFPFLIQFPTLGFIVERYWEIQAHEPEEFWTINCSHNSDEGTATFSWM